MADARITQIALEESQADSEGRITQIALEESQAKSEAALTQIAIEYSRPFATAAAITQLGLEYSIPYFLQSVSITPDPATFILSSVDPTVAAVLAISPDPATFILRSVDPTVEAGFTANFALSVTPPTIVFSAVSITPDPATFILAGIDPDAYHGHVLFPTAADMRLSGISPSISGTFIRVTRKRMRIIDTDYGRPGIVIMKLVDENPRHYDAVSPGAGAGGGQPDTILSPGLSAAFLLDTTMFRDADDDAGFYIAATPETGNPDAWSGAVIFQSTDNGQTWTEFAFVENAAVMGIAETAMPSVADWTAIDTTSSVTVRLFGRDGELESFTQADAEALLSPILLGDEVICYTDATQLSTSPVRYLLDGAFVRARRGTDWAVGTHAVGERFIFLDQNTIRRAIQTVSDLNIERLYRVVSVGQNIEFSYVQRFTNTGIALKPYSPVEIQGARDGSNNLTVTWERRSRIAGEMGSGSSLPLGETTEAYEVEYYTDDFVTLRRTRTGVTSPTDIYTAAEQTTDGGTPGEDIGVKIYQISASVGRGFPGSAVV